jgi:hypothetical protein
MASHQRREAIKRVNAEKETLGEIARSYNVSRWTISRLSPCLCRASSLGNSRPASC